MSTPISLRAYAALRGLNPSSVVRAVKSGRLVECVVRDAAGRPKIADVELADREWAARTDLTKAPTYVKERAAVAAAAHQAPALFHEDDTEAPGADSTPPVNDAAEALSDRPSLSEAAAREKHWRAMRAELDYKKQTGELVSAAAVEQRITGVYGRTRNKLLGLPRKAKQVMPHLNHKDVLTLDTLVREALDELAGGRGEPAPPSTAASSAPEAPPS